MDSNINQKEVFLNSEGDKWFNRNNTNTARKEISKDYRMYSKYLQKNFKILEIGCADGLHLQYFHDKTACDCYGIDPAKEAIAYGKKAYPDINLSVATADKLPYPDQYFDFILYGCCLYLVDRELLAKVVAEGDRVLKNKGFLGIIDFDPKLPKKRPYRHVDGMMSYKMDYSSLFCSFPQYFQVDKYSYALSSDSFTEDVSERVSAVLLFKDQENAYVFEEDRP